MKPADVVALPGGILLAGVIAAHTSPLGVGLSGVVAALAVAGLRSRRCAGAAVLVACVALALLPADVWSALVGGLAATAYLVGTHTEWTHASARELGAGAVGAVLFGVAAALAGTVGTHLAWAPAVAPIAALVVAVLPLRIVRAVVLTPKYGGELGPSTGVE
ncbi:hypothetical protein ABZ942_00305 [Nocardia sp. NPDC046473]|uniref:hypothetical protein n=1 Tax=Nocardia sp. NPDC046473 TaxID=3155733 RepID=UPI0033C5DFBE